LIFCWTLTLTLTLTFEDVFYMIVVFADAIHRSANKSFHPDQPHNIFGSLDLDKQPDRLED
jgi:hypothetical protein